MEPTTWRERREKFEELIRAMNGGTVPPNADDAVDLSVWRSGILGGPENDLQRQSVHNDFHRIASRAAAHAGVAVKGDEQEYEAWRELLCKKLRPANDQYFSSYPVSVHVAPIQHVQIPLSQIDSDHVMKSAKAPPRRSVDKLVKSIKRDGKRGDLTVEPGDGNRFVVIPEDRVKYAACVALKIDTMPCVVREPGVGEDEPPPQWFADDMVIDHACRASAELCEMLESEAYARERATDQRASEIRQEAAQAKGRRSEQTITDVTKRRRRRLVEKYRQKTSQEKNLKEKMTVPDLARHMRMSATAIQGIIREDRSRFSDGTQARFLTLIGVTRSRWYAK